VALDKPLKIKALDYIKPKATVFGFLWENYLPVRVGFNNSETHRIIKNYQNWWGKRGQAGWDRFSKRGERSWGKRGENRGESHNPRISGN